MIITNIVIYYEIYDINTVEIKKKKICLTKQELYGIMIQKVVNLDKESHLVNGKIIFQREYKEDETVAWEYNYKK